MYVIYPESMDFVFYNFQKIFNCYLFKHYPSSILSPFIFFFSVTLVGQDLDIYFFSLRSFS